VIAARDPKGNGGPDCFRREQQPGHYVSQPTSQALKQPDKKQFVKAMKSKIDSHTNNRHWIIYCTLVISPSGNANIANSLGNEKETTHHLKGDL
jgi:hypothetical protein